MAEMFKSDIVEAISKKTGDSKVASENALNAFLEVVKEALKKGNDVSLIGFGKFSVISTKEKTGRNPSNGKQIKIPAGKRVKFSVGKGLKDSVKKK